MPTVDMALRRNGRWLDGVAPVRLGLVVTMVAYQCLEVSASYGRLVNSLVWIVPAVVVPALFALGGFLLAQSLHHRGSVREFLRRRFLRYWPVVALAVIGSALVVGPLATSEGVADYFRDPELPLYLLNLVAIPVERLPQVFTTNYVTTVNDILWASPIAVAGMAILGTASRSRRPTLIMATTLAAVAATALALQLSGIEFGGELAQILSVITGKGLSALACFLLGAIAWYQRSRLAMNRIVTAVAALVVGAVAVLGAREWADLAVLNAAIAFPLTYLVLTTALAPVPFIRPVAAVQKYLSGFILFAYPIAQLVVASRRVGDSFPAVFGVSVPVSALLAVAAWHLVQRRFFTLSRIDDQRDARSDVDSQPLGLAERWRRGWELMPEVALWAMFLIVAMTTMAMTVVAFAPESDGI